MRGSVGVSVRRACSRKPAGTSRSRVVRGDEGRAGSSEPDQLDDADLGLHEYFVHGDGMHRLTYEPGQHLEPFVLPITVDIVRVRRHPSAEPAPITGS